MWILVMVFFIILFTEFWTPLWFWAEVSRSDSEAQAQSWTFFISVKVEKHHQYYKTIKKNNSFVESGFELFPKWQALHCIPFSVVLLAVCSFSLVCFCSVGASHFFGCFTSCFEQPESFGKADPRQVHFNAGFVSAELNALTGVTQGPVKANTGNCQVSTAEQQRLVHVKQTCTPGRFTQHAGTALYTAVVLGTLVCLLNRSFNSPTSFHILDD